MFKVYFSTIAIFISIVTSDNVGWKSYLVENPTEFHDIPLIWDSGNLTKVPNWLSGIYVRNGPAQVNNTLHKSHKEFKRYFKRILTIQVEVANI